MLKGNSVELLALLLTNIWVSVKKKNENCTIFQFSTKSKELRTLETLSFALINMI